MWRHLLIAVVAHKTVVQRVRSNRWRFNFEMAGRGGQINFLWKTAMIITITKTSYNLSGPKRFTLDVPNQFPPSLGSWHDIADKSWLHCLAFLLHFSSFSCCISPSPSSLLLLLLLLHLCSSQQNTWVHPFPFSAAAATRKRFSYQSRAKRIWKGWRTGHYQFWCGC